MVLSLLVLHRDVAKMAMSADEPSPHRVPHLGRPLRSQDIPWLARARVLAVWLVSVLAIILILVARVPFTGQVTVEEGEVAQRDTVAPRQTTFVSQVLTQQRRDMAANAVPDVYDPPQPRIGRQQLILAAQIIESIGTVRNDSSTDTAAKAARLTAISGLNLSPQVIDRIVLLPPPAWERVVVEVPLVLERAMREEIRENNLADERRKVPARVRLDLPDEDAAVVSGIVQDLLLPNSFFNQERTDQRRQTARDAVEPVTRTVERDETILRAGDIVTDLEIEALQALGLQGRNWSWDDLLAVTGFVLLLGVVFLYYFWRQEPELWFRWVEPVLLAAAIVIFILAAKLMIPARTLLPYLFPYAALTIILAISLSLRVALVTTGLFVLVVGWLTGGNLELMAYALCGSLVGVLKVRRGERLGNFAWAALFVLITNLMVVLAFRLAGGHWDARGLIELIIAAAINSVVMITATLLGLYLIGAVFGLATPLQLQEISRPTHPLLRQLLLKAPGTYHHALIVSNMAERAAEAVGADTLLTRVGAYYHDVGKTIRPYFFVENRSEGMDDPHARLDPYTSAQIIMAHVKDGVDLARKHRLPERIVQFIPEHHGTQLVSFFYHAAVEGATAPEAVDKEQFRYPGPRPQSRETAITMLADGAEATVRSKRPTSMEELERIVAESIQNRLLAGQLEECSLTTADLAAVKRAFVDVLRGLHHPRVNYPTEVAPQPAPEPRA
jgi:putative nucleotidyltransferase with HDIG domain